MMSRRAIGIVLAIGAAYVVLKGVANAPSSSSSSAPEVYPESAVTYAQLDAEVGCKSKYSDQKKDDIFDSSYKNHWMTMKGSIDLVDSDNVSLNLDGKGTQDLRVDFADKNAGYNLTKGSQIKVRFLMTSVGGCFLPFGGKEATIVQ